MRLSRGDRRVWRGGTRVQRSADRHDGGYTALRTRLLRLRRADACCRRRAGAARTGHVRAPSRQWRPRVPGASHLAGQVGHRL